MSQLKGLTGSAGSGLQIGVVLPDTTSSTRWVDFDAPYWTTALTAAGLSSSQFKIDNAQGSDATQLSDATADINLGAKVLVVCPLDGPTGVAIAKLAEQKGVTLIAYDRAIFEGSKTYYVSFDNEKVGELIGTGFNQCLTDWKVKNPQVYVLNGGQDTDPNAISFATGYNKVVFGQAAKTVAAGTKGTAGGATLVAENFAPGWDNTKGGTIFQQAFTANPKINATIEANDGLANSVITVLKTAGVKAKTIPTTGQDATAQGMAWVLQGYQCGSVYKAVLQGGPGRRGHGRHPAGRRDAARVSAEQHDHRPGQLVHHRAGVPDHPGVGDRGQHGVDSRQGRLRQGLGHLRDRGCERLLRSRDQLIRVII